MRDDFVPVILPYVTNIVGKGIEGADLVGSKRVVVNTDIVDSSLEHRVGYELAPTDVVEDGTEVGRTGFNGGVGGHWFAVEIDSYGFIGKSDGNVNPLVGTMGGLGIHELFVSAVFDGQSQAVGGVGLRT